MNVDDIAAGMPATVVWMPRRRDLFCPLCKRFVSQTRRDHGVHVETGVTCPTCTMRMLDAPEGSFPIDDKRILQKLHLSRRYARFVGELGPTNHVAFFSASPATVERVAVIIGKKGGMKNGSHMRIRDEGSGDMMSAVWKREEHQTGWRIIDIHGGVKRTFPLGADAWAFLGERIVPSAEAR